MNNIYISVGAESSPEEYQAVKDTFANYKEPYPVANNYMRMSGGGLPMVVMIMAQNVAGNVIWDLMKYSYTKLLSDKRLQSRKPTIVVKRKTFDAVISEKGFHIRSYKENLSFNKIDDLIKYDQKNEQSDDTTSSGSS